MPTPIFRVYHVECRNCARLFAFITPKSNWVCSRCDGSFERRLMWSRLWTDALKNMPAMAICHASEAYAYRRGSATALRMCLGYQVYNGRGRSNAGAANYNAMKRGSQPRGADRQRMLRALAGPHGAVIARARLIQIGQAHRFSIWPTGATHDGR